MGFERIKGNGSRNIDSKIKLNKEQANNFILIINNKHSINNLFINQINKLFNDSKRKWVKQIILIERNKLIKAYKRK